MKGDALTLSLYPFRAINIIAPCTLDVLCEALCCFILISMDLESEINDDDDENCTVLFFLQ